MVEPNVRHGGPAVIGLSPDPQDEAASPHRKASESPSDPPDSLYKDIWSLRATLEQYAASDQSSNNDRNSVCSDADSVCSLGGHTEADRGELPSYVSQDLGDDPEGGEDDRDVFMDTYEKEGRWRKEESRESEQGGGNGETGSRKLLQMDSGYASIEGPSRGPEDPRLFGSSSPKDRTAHEKRHRFTSTGRTGTIGESFESRFFEEEMDEELLPCASGGVSIETGDGLLSWFPYGQMLTRRDAAQFSSQPPRLHRRDYSIDEKTDALFHEFLRHDPQFDQQESPRKHRSRIHLRKQWQRHKQWSDPGVRHFHSSFERQRTPLRRGESVNYPLDTSYHSTLPRIVSAPDEEASEGTSSAPEVPQMEPSESCAKDSEECEATRDPPLHQYKDTSLVEPHYPHEDGRTSGLSVEPQEERSPSQLPDSLGFGPQTITAELTDKLTATLDERLYTSLCRTKDTATECVTVMATYASPDHSPV